jgi:DNA-binding CsgD family transcriptional regulator
VADTAPGRGGLAGRASELALLHQWQAEALGGHGRLVILTGPPGIGKTRLAEEFADRARDHGQAVVWGRAADEHGAPPLWLWRRILATLAGAEARQIAAGKAGSAQSDDLVAARFRAVNTAASALRSAADAADLLVVLEDLQWADHASLLLLREVAAELPGSRLLLLATCRDTAGDPWRAALGDLARLPGLRVLPLAPLSEDDVAEILRGCGLPAGPDLTRAVHARSEGNPLYATTLARVLAAQPGLARDAEAVTRIAGGRPEIRHLVSALIRDIDDDGRAVLAAASVLGTEFGSGLVTAVCGAGPDVTAALPAAETAGLVSRLAGQPGSWRFAHALIRDGIYAGLGEDHRTALHARAAAALTALAQENPERGGEVAAHLMRAAPDRASMHQAAAWAATAATAATSRFAFEDAASYLAAALAAADAAGAADSERAQLLIELATAEYRAGKLGDSLSHATAAADAADRAGRLDLLGSAALVVRGIGYPTVAATLLDLAGRALADPALSPALRARLLAQRASALAELGDRDAAAAESRAAMTEAAAAADPAAELDAIRARIAATAAIHLREEQLRLGARAIELALAADQPLAAVLGRVWRIDAAYQFEDIEAVDAEIIQVARLADSTRLPLARWHLLRQQASRAALAGEFARARDLSWQAYRLASRLQDPSGASLSYQFALWLAIVRGDPGEIPADFLQITAAAPPLPVIKAAMARALFALGRTDEARAVYETIRRLPAAGNSDTRTLGAFTQLIDVIIGLRDLEMAQATYDLFQLHAESTRLAGTGVVFLSGSLHWPLGQLAALLGRTEQALDHFASAVASSTRSGARPFVVLARLDWAQALQQQAVPGGRAQARDLARQAAIEARRLDMPGPAARAENLAGELGQDRHAANPLTRREREIAELTTAGLTNRAIAEHLTLSERTIEGHIRSALAKLQLTNRTELATWALKNRDLAPEPAGSCWPNRRGRACTSITAGPAGPGRARTLPLALIAALARVVVVAEPGRIRPCARMACGTLSEGLTDEARLWQGTHDRRGVDRDRDSDHRRG